MNILITGSEGVIGKVATKVLKEEGHDLTLLDKKPTAPYVVDLLTDEIDYYFKGIETTIHLAAHPKPWISLEQAQENFFVAWNVLEACRKARVRRFINASSLNVYDIEGLWLKKEKITYSTPTIPHPKKKWKGSGEGEIFYARMKLAVEALAKGYYQTENISILNLRFGGVNSEYKPPLEYFEEREPFESSAWLSHKDLSEIIKRAICFNGLESIACVSANPEDFVDLQPIKEILGYKPQ